MKRYITEIHEHAPKGKLLRYEHIDATCKSDFRQKVNAWNKEHPNEWMAEKTAFVLAT